MATESRNGLDEKSEKGGNARRSGSIEGPDVQVRRLRSYKSDPTVYPNLNFDPADAAKCLQTAMEKPETEGDIIRILVGHSNEQRQQIALKFYTFYGRNLIADITSKLGDSFNNAVRALMQPTALFLAHELHAAVKGVGTDESTLIDILFTSSNAEIKAIKKAYQEEFKRTLEEDLASVSSSNFKQLLLLQCDANRDESYSVDVVEAVQDAKFIYKAGAGKWGTDEVVFNKVFCTRNAAQLKATFMAYKELYHKEIEEVIDSETSGDLKNVYLTLVKCVEAVPAFFAERLYKAMTGSSTDETTLIRVIVTRSEVDLAATAEKFKSRYGKSLIDFISSNVKGGYSRLLIAVADTKIGRLQFSIKYEREEQKLTVKIIGVEKLKAMDKTGTSDPYVKITLLPVLPGKKREYTTTIKTKVLNASWNEEFHFEGLSLDSLKSKTLEMRVLDYNSLSSDNSIGKVRIPFEHFDLENGQALWKDLLPSKTRPVPAPIISQYVTSDYPEDQTIGQLKFKISYDRKEQKLALEINEATDLVAMDWTTKKSDPFVKVWLLPDETREFKTTTKTKELNPTWNEVFHFDVPYDELTDKTLFMQVLDYDLLDSNDLLGEVCIPLSYVDFSSDQPLWKNLQPTKKDAGKLGELQLSLRYQPTPGRVTVTIHKARKLVAENNKGLPDPYVEMWLMREGKTVGEKKATVAKLQTLDPVFDEPFEFDVPHDRINTTNLQVNVVDTKNAARKIGQIVLGSKNGPMEIKHWIDMLDNLEQPVTRWHVLKGSDQN